ncbi:MAG TPA: hypothetical protein VF192_07590 [Longimicrobiales bacterium]
MRPSDHAPCRLTALAAALLLAACGSPGTDTPDGQPAPGAPGVDWTSGVVHRASAGTGIATLTRVRTGMQDGHDRIVFEFPGSALPGYHVEYIGRPVRQCGSGEVVQLAGDGWLQIRMEPAQAHDEQGRPTITERAFSPGLPAIREARLTCDFEGQVTWVLGVSSPNPFRVLELPSPPRLVVDVRH